MAMLVIPRWYHVQCENYVPDPFCVEKIIFDTTFFWWTLKARSSTTPRNGRFLTWGYPKMDALESWGYPHDLGKLHFWMTRGTLRSNSDLEAWRLQSHGVPLAWRIQPRFQWIGRSNIKILFKANLTMKCHWYVYIYIHGTHTHTHICIYIYRYVVLWYYMNVFIYTYRQDDDFVIFLFGIFGTAMHLLGCFFWFRVLHCSCHL